MLFIKMASVSIFFLHQLLIKMYHFQTSNYGAHKAADKYLAKYALNFDRFMEVWQGQHGRLEDKRIRLDFSTVTDQTVSAHLDEMADYLSSLEGLSVDLATIRDEMVADIRQFQYLLTFR